MRYTLLILLIIPLFTSAQKTLLLKDSTTLYVYKLYTCDDYYYFKISDSNSLYKTPANNVISYSKLKNYNCYSQEYVNYLFFKRHHIGNNLYIAGISTLAASMATRPIEKNLESSNKVSTSLMFGACGLALSGYIVQQCGWRLARIKASQPLAIQY